MNIITISSDGKTFYLHTANAIIGAPMFFECEVPIETGDRRGYTVKNCINHNFIAVAFEQLRSNDEGQTTIYRCKNCNKLQYK